MAIAFWLLDAHLWRQKLLFGRLYERVQMLPEAEAGYTLDTSPVDREAYAWRSVFFMRRLVLLHGGVILSIGIIRGLA
jgi:hypothetical protein